MELTVHGKQMDVGDALKTHVEEKLSDINQKYLNHAAYATVTFSPEGHGHKQTKAHILIKLGKNIEIVGDCTSPDPYASFDTAADKVGKQMRRYKRKLRDHHDRMEQTPETEILKARDYVLAATPEQDDEPTASESGAENDEPMIVAELASHIETMSVSEAVMRLDLGGRNALMFRNVSHGGLNMVYVRKDGNIGWVDPEGE